VMVDAENLGIKCWGIIGLHQRFLRMRAEACHC